MTGFALYRMPYASKCTLLTGEVLEVTSPVELGTQCGFVVAPFAPSAERPILVIRPQQPDGIQVGEPHSFILPADIACSTLEESNTSTSPCTRENYHIDFVNFHSHLLNGDFQKLVLSRSVELKSKEEVAPLELFNRACECYPRMFIALSYTKQSGLWLAATPEVLLASSDRQWQTVALAGTQPWAEHLLWGDKNLKEQCFVATYVAQQLEQFTNDFSEEGPCTVRAGHLAHLRSDFRFTLSDRSRIGLLIEALHPTPAVCGLPKKEAFRFILQNEHHDRSYYSGFMGPLAVDGLTSLFVTLRCMAIHANGYRLYAGGGLLTDSDEDQEWQETEAKLDTMRNIL